MRAGIRAVSAVIVGVVALSISVAAEAKSLRYASGPAEIPPSSFKAAQYVDSRGCVFIRAGYGGQVQWVPRVQRNKQVVCGMTPSRGASAPRPPLAAARVATGKPRQVAVAPRIAARPAPAPTRFTAAPRAIRAPVATPARRGFWWAFFGGTKPRPSTPPQLAPQLVPQPVPAPRLVASRPLMRVAATPTRVPRGGLRYRYASEESSGLQIRRGPQPIHPGDYFNGRLGRNGVPYQAQVTRMQMPLPKGYKSLLVADFDESLRGVGTPEGEAAMDLIWTQTMPRKLIDVTTGRDMTRQLPRIKYPYVTASTMSYRPAVPAYAPAARRSNTKKKKRPVRDEASPANIFQSGLLKIKRIADVSARDPSVAKVPSAVSAPGLRQYVQVATFGVPKNASRTLARFRLTGLPAMTRPLKRRGKTYDIVLLGPFNDRPALQAALIRARGAGFADAFYVK